MGDGLVPTRQTAPGAERADLLKLDIPTLIVPGTTRRTRTSAARYLEECLPQGEVLGCGNRRITTEAERRTVG
jgi:hypothetical protein